MAIGPQNNVEISNGSSKEAKELPPEIRTALDALGRGFYNEEVAYMPLLNEKSAIQIGNDIEKGIATPEETEAFKAFLAKVPLKNLDNIAANNTLQRFVMKYQQRLERTAA